MGPCGLVVGATVGQALVDLGIDLSVFNGPILSPGYGAQGASAAACTACLRVLSRRCW